MTRPDEARLIRIFERSATLSERLRGILVTEESDSTAETASLVDRRLNLWCQTAAYGDWERFRAQLAARGYDLERARRALGPVRMRAGAVLPPWVQTLAAIARGIESGSYAEAGESTLFQPFSDFARRRLAELAGDGITLFSEAALNSFLGHLTDRLSQTARPVLDLMFHAFCAVRYPLTPAPLPDLDAQNPRCREFESRMLAGEWLNTFEEFPVLARMLATLVDYWIEFARVLLSHLRRDLGVLEARFQPGQTIHRVAYLDAGLSDSHHCGRSVVRVTFDTGLTLLYKPKNLAIDDTWFSLLEWLGTVGGPPFKRVKLLLREEHGWAEPVVAGPVTEAYARDFCEIAGALLCLLYILDGTDLHEENVLTAGDQPVFVDLETLMQPGIRWDGPAPASQRFPATVLKTHFLPEWVVDSDGDTWSTGGLTEFRTPDGKLIALGHEDTLLDGFRRMYRLMMSQKEALTSPRGPIPAFAGLRMRPIFQDTPVYERMRHRSLQPDVLRDGVDRSIRLEHVYRLPVSLADLGKLAARCRQEADSLERLDIPLFQAPTSSTDLILESPDRVANLFEEPALNRVIARILELNEADMERQVELIRGALCFQTALVTYANTAAGSRGRFEGCASRAGCDLQHGAAPAPDNTGYSPDDLLGAAVDIAEDVLRTAMRTRDGAIWAIPKHTWTARGKVYSWRPSDWSLYRGNPGIALFLAALESVRGVGRYGDMALDALRPVRAFLDNSCLQPRIGIGIAAGLSSIVYALVRAGEFLDDVALRRSAEKAADAITSRHISDDRNYDVFDGAAGAVLGLLTLHEADKESDVLQRAVRGGNHLLEGRTPAESGHRVWKTFQGKYISGFAHGMAGIAYALLRLFEATGEREYQSAAEEAISFESTVFSPAQGNWRAFGSQPEAPIFWNAFCHGAAGIGLARLGGLSVLDTPQVRQDLEMALQTASNGLSDGVDHLCCGNFGRIGLLSAHEEVDEGRSASGVARFQACKLVRLRRQRGTFLLQAALQRPVRNPGFFRGTAGIGYELLRLAYPNRFPCVLLFR